MYISDILMVLLELDMKIYRQSPVKYNNLGDYNVPRAM